MIHKHVQLVGIFYSITPSSSDLHKILMSEILQFPWRLDTYTLVLENMAGAPQSSYLRTPGALIV